jgi:predicted CXXCH cytochrome family protein
MKKIILTAVAIGFVTAGTASAVDNFAGSNLVGPGDGIVGSVHDLSTSGNLGYATSDPLDRICIWCHAPHHAMEYTGDIDYLPLWNHGVTTLFYNTYQSDFGGGPMASGALPLGFEDAHLFNGEDSLQQPGSVSRLCLSCHDGSVAVNEYGRDPQRLYSQEHGTDIIDDQFKIGALGNLTNHHPIGFSYEDVAALDDEIAPMATAVGGTTIAGLLYDNSAGINANFMECVTCHDVHNTKNTGETLLWITNESSQFCLTCHLKGSDAMLP